MEELLLWYQDLFVTPTGVSLEQARSHQIQLLPGMAVVVIQPYRYAHAQKEKLEWQCDEMLHLSIICPSASTFSALVLLVKKQDNSWRFGVRALND
jgi:hypothetical protein